MKITVVNGEIPEKRYIAAGTEKVASVTDYSSNKEMPHHDIEWGIDIDLGRGLSIIKKLSGEARYYQTPSQKILSELGYIYLSKTPIIDRFRFLTIDEFWASSSPIAQVGDGDICIGLITSFYAMHFYKLSEQQQEFQTLRQGINRANFSAFSNCSDIIAELVAKTSPHLEDSTFTRFLLRGKLDDPLSRYQKPIKLN